VSVSGRWADFPSGHELPSPGKSEKGADETGQIPFVLALGSNLGDRRENLARGLRFLGERLQIEAVSRTMESPPWGPVPQGAFLNLALRGTGADNPFALLDIAQAAEEDAGRRRDVRYGPRTLDVDLIFFGDLMLDHPDLTLPHPRWEERPFVRNLLPEIGGEMVNPVTGRRLVDVPGVAGEMPR
jgi:2-amino-4-hydroxy-6-hydroxymethyldihydropteridine diphosphokinase